MLQLREEARESRKKLVAEGHLVHKVELASRLGVDAAELDEAVRDQGLFFLEVGSAGDVAPYFPAFYADAGLNRDELERVCRALGDLGSGSKWHFFVRPHAYFRGLTPLDALREGRIEEVERAALAYAEK